MIYYRIKKSNCFSFSSLKNKSYVFHYAANISLSFFTINQCRFRRTASFLSFNFTSKISFFQQVIFKIFPTAVYIMLSVAIWAVVNVDLFSREMTLLNSCWANRLSTFVHLQLSKYRKHFRKSGEKPIYIRGLSALLTYPSHNTIRTWKIQNRLINNSATERVITYNT